MNIATTNRMCRTALALSTAAFLSCGIAIAQSQPQGQNGSMAGQNGSMAGQNSSMHGQNGSMPGMNDQMGSMGNGGTSMSDKNFVKKAMEGSNAEIQLGQLAQQKAQSEDVKQFAQKMVDDHTKLNEQMQPVAQQLGIQPNDDVPAKEKMLKTKLQGMQGQDFDKAYIKAMAKDHKMDLKEFQKEAQNGKNPQVKEAASQGEQVIEGHLQMIEQIAQSHGVNVKENDKASKMANSSGTTQ